MADNPRFREMDDTVVDCDDLRTGVCFIAFKDSDFSRFEPLLKG
jgi:hypothetical protein